MSSEDVFSFESADLRQDLRTAKRNLWRPFEDYLRGFFKANPGEAKRIMDTWVGGQSKYDLLIDVYREYSVNFAFNRNNAAEEVFVGLVGHRAAHMMVKFCENNPALNKLKTFGDEEVRIVAEYVDAREGAFKGLVGVDVLLRMRNEAKFEALYETAEDLLKAADNDVIILDDDDDDPFDEMKENMAKKLRERAAQKTGWPLDKCGAEEKALTYVAVIKKSFRYRELIRIYTEATSALLSQEQREKMTLEAKKMMFKRFLNETAIVPEADLNDMVDITWWYFQYARLGNDPAINHF